MSSIELSDVNGGYNLVKINENFTEIQRVINEELLHRVNEDGSPNSLETDIDANSNRIYNLPTPTTGGEPIRLKDLFGAPDELLGGPEIEHITATAGQTVFTLSTSYVTASNSLYVFRNGVLLENIVDYAETSSTTVTILTGVDDGDVFTFAPVAVSVASEGGSTSATSLGSGADVYKQKVGDTLQFRSLVAGSNVTLTEGADGITIAATGGGGGSGEANTTSNLGTGVGLAATKVGVNLPFKSIEAGTGITLNDDGSTVTITNNTPATSISATNLGAVGEGVYASKLGSELRFKKLVAGTNVSLASGVDSITINATGGGSSSLGFFNVKDYGAVGDNITNDTTAVNNAIAAAISAGGGAVWFPGGKYVLSSAVTATLTNGVGIALLGAGVDITELKFTNGSGVTITCVGEGYWAYPGSGIPHGNAVTVHGLTMSTGVHNTGTALTISSNTLTGRPVPAINISNLTLRGTDVTKAWARGIHFDKADAANVSHFNWFGKIVEATGVVVEITADATHNVSAFRFNNCGWTYADIGVKAGAYVEGIHINNTDMVLVNKGVEWLCGTTVESELAMSNTHIAAVLYCVHVQGLMDSHINNSLFFVSGAPTTWNGIRMDYSAATISNCFFGGANAVSNVGIVHTNLVTGSNAWAAFHPTSITNCVFRAMPVGITLGSLTGNVFVGADNQYSSEVTTRVNNSSTASIVEKKTFAGTVVPTLAGGATSETISVAIPPNTYGTAPEGGFLTLAQNAEDLIGFFLFDSSTATNAQFLVKRRDGGVLPSGPRRFSFSLIGL
jgi:hypothetical protein